VILISDKSLGISVTGDIDDISAKLDAVASQLDGLADQTIELMINADTTSLSEVATVSDEVSSELESVSESVESVGSGIEGIDSTSLSEAASHANALGNDLGSTATEANNASTEIDSATESTDAFTAAAGAVVALGLSAVFIDAANAAGYYEDSWGRVGLAMETGADTAQSDWGDAVSQMTSITGRSASEARDFLISMGTAGITSSDLLESSFENIAATAYRTGSSIEGVSNKFKVMVSTGAIRPQSLIQLGITTGDVYEATGLTMDEFREKFKNATETQRAEMLNSIMAVNDSKAANDEYKQSWQHLIDIMGRAWGYLNRVFGELILPVAIPAMEMLANAINSVAGWMSSLDPVSKGLLTGVVALIAGFTFLVGTLGTLKFVLDTLKISWALNLLGINTSTLAADAHIIATNAQIFAQKLLNRELWTSAATYAKDIILKGASIALTIAQATYTEAAAAAQWLLNTAFFANPIGMTILAITALVAGLVLLYQNNEQVRASIDGLWNSIQGFGAYLADTFVTTLNSPIVALQDFIDDIKSFGSDLYDSGKNWINDLTRGISDSIPSLDDVLQRISDYFPHSPAKTGPLSTVTPENMNAYGQSLGAGLKEGFRSGLNLEDPNTLSITNLLAGIGNPYDVLINTSNQKAVASTQEAEAKISKAKADGIKKTFEDLTNLDKKTYATYDSMAASAMSAAEQMQYGMKVAAHNTAAAWENAMARVAGSMSALSSMFGAMGISMPESTYSTAELLRIRSDSIKEAKLNLQEAKENYRKGEGSYADVLMLQKELDQLQSHETLAAIMKSGQSVGQTWGNGVASGITSSANNINSAIATASRGFIANSPPVEGPLMNIDKDGLNIGSIFAENIGIGLNRAKGVINAGLNQISPTLNAPSLSPGASQNIRDVKVEFSGPITIPEGSDPYQVGRELARGTGDGLADKLGIQVSNMGISTVDDRR